MSNNNMSLARDYYTALGSKKLEFIEKHLHPDVQFIGPLDQRAGKTSVFEAIQNFAAALQSLKIRAQFGSDDQAVIVYDVNMPPFGIMRGVSIMTIQEGLVTKIELFYDSHLMTQLKDQIFSN